MDNQATTTAPDLNINTAIARMEAAVNAASAECLPTRAAALVDAWSKLHGLTLGQVSIADDARALYKRADDALDNISTAVDQFRPDVNDPFVAHVLAVLASLASAAPPPALLSDVPMGG